MGCAEQPCADHVALELPKVGLGGAALGQAGAETAGQVKLKMRLTGLCVPVPPGRSSSLGSSLRMAASQGLSDVKASETVWNRGGLGHAREEPGPPLMVFSGGVARGAEPVGLSSQAA